MKKHLIVKPLAVLLTWLVPAAAMAQQEPVLHVGPLRPPEPQPPVVGLQNAPVESQETADSSQAPAPLDDKQLNRLRNKKVIVQLRDGREYRGELVEFTEDFLVVKILLGRDLVRKAAYYRKERIAWADVAWIRAAEATSLVEELPPDAPVHPTLLNKKVVVHLYDGRLYKGRLVNLTRESLHLKITDAGNPNSKAATRIEEIAYADVALVHLQAPKPRPTWVKALRGVGWGALYVGYYVGIGALYLAWLVLWCTVEGHCEDGNHHCFVPAGTPSWAGK